MVWCSASFAAIDAWQLVHHDQLDWKNEMHRLAVATDLFTRVQILSDTVPQLTEARAAKVLRRQKKVALDDARARSRFFLSNDYQHWVLVDRLKSIQVALQCVMDAADDGEPEKLAAEMVCWGRASLAFAREEDIALALDRLREARLMLREEKIPVRAKDPRIWYADFSRGIIAYIVVPYLEAQASEVTQVEGSGD